MLWHVGGQVVEHAALAEQGLRPGLDGDIHEVWRGGTYRIANNILELTYADGRREQHFFFRYPGEETQIICINGANYLRRGQ